jgi:ABC-2 type transport system ATP-binding protein
VIVADGLARSFAGRPAVREVSLRVEPGEVVGLLGPNGAGKTTTIRLLLGVLQPDAGTLQLDGPVGYLPESLAAYDALAVVTHLRFLAKVKGAPLADVLDVVDRCELRGLLRRPVARLSKGQRQRVGLAGALLGGPPTLVLDEPTQGLDPRQAVDARRIIRAEADRGAAVLVSTHALAEAAAVCDRVAILVDGIVADEGPPGDPGELEERFLAAAGAAAAAEVGMTKRQRTAATTTDDRSGARPALPVALHAHQNDDRESVAPPEPARRRRGAGPLAVAGKDLRSLLTSPVPWVGGAVFHAVVGLLFVDQLAGRGQAVLQPLFPIAGFLVLAVSSLITMRSIADEARSGTLELLEAANLSPAALAVGKWLAAWIVTLLVLAPLGVAVALVAQWGDPDMGVATAGMIGLTALAGAACGVGVLASSLTSSQPVAAALSFFLTALAWFSAAGPGGTGSPMARLSFSERLRSSAGGALDSADLGLFVIVAVVGIVGSWLALRARRLR